MTDLYILLICISLLSVDSMLLYNSKLSRLSLLSATSMQLPIQIPIESNEIKQKRPRNRAILTYISSSSANVTLPLNLPIDISTLQSYIIYEDNDLIVLDKPSTLLSQPEKETIQNKKVDNNIVSDNIYDATLRYLEEKLKFNNYENENNNNNNNNDTNNENNDIYLALINRLDRPCSGVMVMCKNKKSAGKLSEALKERTLSTDNIETNLEVKEEKFKKIDKQYFAILNNHINESAINETITLSNMISKSTTSKVKIFENDNTNTTTRKSKNLVKATLQYKLLKNFFAGTKKGEVQGESSGNPQSLVKIFLQSGRKHQIRAQFGHINHPIIGDLKYSANQQFKEKDIALHSYLISLKHPGTGKKMKFISKVPLSWNKRFGQHIVDECDNVIHNITISDDIKYI
jgi:23S rRNA pseudouridine1911/1915/1917 synthase